MNDSIKLEHGSGGALSRELVEEIIYPHLAGAAYPSLSDGTYVSCRDAMCMTTDTYVVDPIFFPGGDIGKLAVFGTCNDLAVSGAEPKYLSLGFLLEEGFPIEDLVRILKSIAEAAESSGVSVVTGDTKVVPAGKGGGIYINSTGIGAKVFPGQLDPSRIGEGNVIIASGPVGAHGIAVLASRENLPVGGGIRSDCANLYPLCSDLFALGDGLLFLRDATRGGVAAILNEIVSGLTTGILVREADIPVDEGVRVAAGILGLNPLEIANEGVCIAVVAKDGESAATSALRRHEAGKGAVVIGEVTGEFPGKVILKTRVGGWRTLDIPRGILLPRIC